jgi:hypothetical protein
MAVSCGNIGIGDAAWTGSMGLFVVLCEALNWIRASVTNNINIGKHDNSDLFDFSIISFVYLDPKIPPRGYKH